MSEGKGTSAPADFGIFGGNGLDESLAATLRHLAALGPFAVADVLLNNGTQPFKANAYEQLCRSSEIGGGRVVGIIRIYCELHWLHTLRHSFIGPPHLGCQPLVVYPAYSAEELSRIFKREAAGRVKEWLEECRSAYLISDERLARTGFRFRSVKVTYPASRWILVFLEPHDLDDCS